MSLPPQLDFLGYSERAGVRNSVDRRGEEAAESHYLKTATSQLRFVDRGEMV